MLIKGQALVTAHLLLGYDAWEHGRADEAKLHWERAFEADPQSSVVANNLAWALASGQAHELKRALDLVALGWRQVQRHINAEPLTPQRVVPLRVGLSRVHSWEAPSEGLLLGRELSYGFGINRGLPIWNATLDPAKPILSAPRAEFWKFDAALGVAQGLRDIGVLRLDVVGQWTDHPLYFDDQLTLGSQSSVRGFANTAAKVDRGVFIRSEFAARLPIDNLQIDSNDWTFLDDTLRALQPYIFVDAGYGEMIADARGLTRASAGGGMRYAYGRTNFDISIAHPVYAQGTARIKYNPEVYFTLNLKLL